MSNQNVVEVSELSKSYRLGVYTADTLVEDMKLWWSNRKNINSDKSNIQDERIDKNGIFWALRDVNFEVKQGEILGIVGKNGAGKSTLLKILSRVTSPTKGEIRIKGRVASLLEVGTGFHPELTGKENIFLNGAILGMTRKEITGKLEEIIEFSGVTQHIDTPVKRYSSGMKVRLGFAVAAHLEPEILVVDEVLAVGDADFQKKCLGKMEDVSKTGRTILFVSHNMTAVRNLCTKAILLNEGKIVYNGETREVVKQYLGGDNGNRVHFVYNDNEAPGVENFKIKEIKVFAKNKSVGEPILMEDSVVIQIFHLRKESENRFDISLQFKGESGEILFSNGSGRLEDPGYKTGNGLLEVVIPPNLFNSGVFEVNLMGIEKRRNLAFTIDSLISFTIVQNQRLTGSWQGRAKGDLYPDLAWKYSPC